MKLRCPTCHHAAPASAEALLARLQQSGLLKRASREERKDLAYLVALAQTVADQWPCPACDGIGLTVDDAAGGGVDFAGGQPCAACGKMIPAERMELFPNTTLCTACQSIVDAGGTPDTQEYCPRCGSLMQIRAAGGSGVARYALVCPECRR
jgi:DNA-directed RNA polymerase subunit M/transcription elongation factor TFIIS